MKPLRGFVLALSFLSRLAPGLPADNEEMAASFIWHPVAGLVIGLVAALPFALGLAEGKPWLQGLFFVLFLIWLTRALHWDGWADLADAVGSNRHGPAFQEVLKDSRLGAFGVMALALGLGAEVVGSAYCLAAGAWPALIWAVLLGRCMSSPLAAFAPPSACSSLGRVLGKGAGKATVPTALVLAVAGGFACVGPAAALCSLLAAFAGFVVLLRLALREGGVNGDFMGAGIIWGELSALLVCALIL